MSRHSQTLTKLFGDFNSSTWVVFTGDCSHFTNTLCFIHINFAVLYGCCMHVSHFLKQNEIEIHPEDLPCKKNQLSLVKQNLV